MGIVMALMLRSAPRPRYGRVTKMQRGAMARASNGPPRAPAVRLKLGV